MDRALGADFLYFSVGGPTRLLPVIPGQFAVLQRLPVYAAWGLDVAQQVAAEFAQGCGSERAAADAALP